jgi:hypothetical protein
LKKEELGKINPFQKEGLINLFEKIIGRSIHNLESLTFEELNRLNEFDFVKIVYKSNTDSIGKNISFVSYAILEIFDKSLLKNNDMDLYMNMLKHYLNTKDYIEYNRKLILIDKNLIERIDNKTLLKVFTNKSKFNNKNIIIIYKSLKSEATTKEILEKLKKLTLKATLKSHQEAGVK